MRKLHAVYHGETGIRTLKELARSYLTITRDLTRVMNRTMALGQNGIAVFETRAKPLLLPGRTAEMRASRLRLEWIAETLRIWGKPIALKLPDIFGVGYPVAPSNPPFCCKYDLQIPAATSLPGCQRPPEEAKELRGACSTFPK